MNYFARIYEMFLDPSRVYRKAKEEHVIKAFIFYVSILALLLAADWAIMYYDMVPANLNILKNAGLNEFNVLYIPLIFSLINLIAIFVFAASVFVFARVWKVKARMPDMFRAFAYGSVPMMITAWLPVFNAVSVFWSFFLVSKGFSDYTKTGMKRSLTIGFLGLLMTGIMVVAGIYLIMGYIHLDITLKNFLGMNVDLF